MKLKPLVLSVKKSQFRMDDPTKDHSDAEFKAQRKPVLERDGSTCQYCSFYAKKWQEVHHLDNNHSNNELSNLITACPLCHQVHHVGFSGIRNSAKLIFMDPELGISQAHLNQVVRALWIAKSSGNQELANHAQSLLSRIHKYTIVAHMKIGTCDPIVLSDFMLNMMTPAQYKNRAKIFAGIYLLPLEPAFEQQVKYWRESIFSDPKDWEEIASQQFSKWLSNDGLSTDDHSMIEFMNQYPKPKEK